MNAIQLESQFAAMGARLKVRDVPSRWRQGDRTWIAPQDYAVDIQRDGNGQFLELGAANGEWKRFYGYPSPEVLMAQINKSLAAKQGAEGKK